MNFFIGMNAILALTSVMIFSALKEDLVGIKFDKKNKFLSLLIPRIGEFMHSAV